MLALAAVMLAGLGQDQDVRTLETASRPVMQAGALDGCELDFKTAFRDHVYRKGALSIVNGALIVMGFESPNKRLVVALKLRIADLTGQAPNWQQTWTTPQTAWLMVTPSRTNRASFVQSAPSEDGGLLAVYQFDDDFSIVFGNLVSEKKLTVTFNRNHGGTDIVLPIDFSVPDAAGKGVTLPFAECVSTGAKALQKRLAN